MADRSKDKRVAQPPKGHGTGGRGAKGSDDANWTRGLKKLYDSVVDEPLPDSFRDLLSKLDSED